MNLFRKSALCLCLGFSLTACTLGQGGEPLAQMTFAHVKPYPLYVASYQVSGFEKVFRSTDIPGGFVANPAVIVQDYFNNRFEAAGATGKLGVTIRNVQVTHDVVAPENSIGAMVGVGKFDRYKVLVDIDIEGFGIGQTRDVGTSFVVTRDIKVSEFASLVERQKAQMRALDNMVDDIDETVQKLFRDQFSIMR